MSNQGWGREADLDTFEACWDPGEGGAGLSGFRTGARRGGPSHVNQRGQAVSPDRLTHADNRAAGPRAGTGESYAVVIPAYNEAVTIRDVARRALRFAAAVIVVDDGSTDGTAAAVAGLPVTLLRSSRNEGKAASLWRGFHYALAAGFQGVVTLDGDGQHAPEEIPLLLEQARSHPSSPVIGSRLWNRSAFPPSRYRANRVANFWISWAAGHCIEDSQSGFRVYPAELLRRLEGRCGRAKGFVFESEILIEAARLGYTTVPVRVSAIYPRQARPSHFRPVADIARIGFMVAGKLLVRGFYLQGLYRVLRMARSTA